MSSWNSTFDPASVTVADISEYASERKYLNSRYHLVTSLVDRLRLELKGVENQ